MRDYLATVEESFLSLMFQSYCNFTIAFINTRYVLLPHRKNRPPPPSKYHGSYNPAKTARGSRTFSPIPPVGNSTILLQFHYRFPSPLNPAPLGLHLADLATRGTRAYIWQTGEMRSHRQFLCQGRL